MSKSSGGALRGLFTAFAVLCLCVAAGFCAWLLARSVPGGLSALDPAPQAVTAKVSEGSQTYSTPASLKVGFVGVPGVVSGAQSGLVTELEVVPGASVSSGDYLFSVDNLPVTAYVGETVFFRPLAMDDKGEDVRGLQKLLSFLLPETTVYVDGEFGANTEAGVKRWERRIGAAEPTGVFQPSWFVRLPKDPYLVSKVALVLGGPGPEAGAEIFSGESQPSSAVITTEVEFTGPDGDYVFAFQGKMLPVQRQDGQWMEPDLAESVLLSGRPTEGDFASLSGTIMLAEPETQVTVPASAIIVDGDQTCVAQETGVDQYLAMSVQVLGSAMDGSPLLSSGLSVDDTILLNPGEILTDLSCP